jgi:uncharacterized membrane protein
MSERPAAVATSATRYERGLGVAASALLAVIIVALVRGARQWAAVPVLVWVHLATVLVALALTPVLLWRRRGDGVHRWLGRTWVVAMAATAAVSFGVTGLRPGHLSPIHVISAYTLAMAPLVWWRARRGNVAAHRQAVRGLVLGALLVAGVFTLPFGRMLGRWLLGG